MKKYPLIGISIIAVVFLVLGSFNNIAGYQTVQASNQKIITTELNEKDLLFQTIIDMAKNKEIQKVILGSELTEKRFFDSEMRFSTFKVPVITKQFLGRIYTIGMVLFRTPIIIKSYPVLEKYHMNYAEMQKELSFVIEKDSTLKSEMAQLSSFSCGCGDENPSIWRFPVVCTFLFILASLTRGSDRYNDPIEFMLESFAYRTAETIHCPWVQ